MLLKITRWTPSSEILPLSRAPPEDLHLSHKLSTQGAHSHSDSHSSICMHEGTHNTHTHTHMQDRALTAHPLSGTQQGGHVLESEGATSLQQLLHTLFILRDIYQCRLVALLTIRVCISTVCLCGRACQTHWNRSFCDKRSFSRQSSDVSIYGAHAWPVLTLVFPSAKRSVWDEVISFPSHGRLGDQNIRWALQSPSICGVCFHL